MRWTNVIIRSNPTKEQVSFSSFRLIGISGSEAPGLKAAAEQGCLVFCAEGARAFKENECKWPMWRACKMAGLRLISWHVLRHTFEGGRPKPPSLLFQTPASVGGSRSKIAALAQSARCLREPLCSAPGRRRAVASGSHLETA